MAGVEIAKLFASIEADTKAFDKGLAHVDSALGKAGKSFGALQSVAGGAFLGIAGAAAGAAVGIAGIAVSATKSAAKFEQGIANIRADLQLTAEDTEKVSKLVKNLGLDPKLQVSASQASEAIHMLGKNGLTLDQILNGAARSTVLLANSTGGTFAQSADIATDVMSLFKIRADDMNRAINGIVGTTQFSKFSINDYALALAQGGGVASAVGVSFEDFNATIAAISPLFASGSDAGTSFKTFLQRLVPQTDEAVGMMKQLGLMTENGANQFFDATGKMKSMTEIAGLLQSAFAGLSEEQKNQAATTLFGSDAMRAAFGLAGAGSSGISKFLADIGMADAEQAAATRMDTFSGQMEIFRGIIETLGIEIGQKFLPFSRKMVERFSELASKYGPSVVNVFGGIATWLGETIDKAVDFSTAIAGRFLPAVQGIASFFASTMPSAFKKFKMIVDNVNDPGLARTINRIRGAFSGLGKVLTGLARPFKEAFSGLFQALMVSRGSGWAGIFDTLKTRLMTAVSSLGTALSEQAIPFVLTKLGELGSAIKGWITEVDWWETIKGWAGMFVNWAVGIWDNGEGGGLKAALGSFWNSLISWVVEPGKRQQLWDNLVGAWNGFTEWAGKIWDAISPLLASAWNNISSWVTDENKRTTLWNAVVKGWDVITEWAGKIWDAVSPILATVWNNLSSWFTDEEKRTILWNAVVGTWNMLTTWATNIWEWAKPGLESGWNWLSGWFTDPGKRKQLWDGLVKVWDFLTDWAKKIWDWIDDPLRKGFQWLTSWFTDPQKRQQIWTALETTWDFLTAWAGKIWDWASPSLAGMWGNLILWITDPIKKQQLFDGVAAAWNGFTRWAGKIWDDGASGGLKSKLDAAWTSMNTWITTNLPNLAPWRDAFVGFATGAAAQWAISFPAMVQSFTDLRTTLEEELPKIEAAFGRLWTAMFGGGEGPEQEGRNSITFLEKTFGAISKTIGTIIAQSRLLIEMLAISAEATKALYSGDFARVWELRDEQNKLWGEFGEKTKEQWDFFLGLFNSMPNPSDSGTGGGPGGFAHGGRVNQGGVHWVGENGPELVNLPYGSRVYNNQDSMAMAGGGGRLDIFLHGESNIPTDRGKIRELARALQQELQLSGARVAIA